MKTFADNSIAESKEPPKPPLGAFVHITRESGESEWFYAGNLPEHVMRHFEEKSDIVKIEVVPL